MQSTFEMAYHVWDSQGVPKEAFLRRFYNVDDAELARLKAEAEELKKLAMSEGGKGEEGDRNSVEIRITVDGNLDKTSVPAMSNAGVMKLEKETLVWADARVKAKEAKLKAPVKK